MQKYATQGTRSRGGAGLFMGSFEENAYAGKILK